MLVLTDLGSLFLRRVAKRLMLTSTGCISSPLETEHDRGIHLDESKRHALQKLPCLRLHIA